LPTAASEVEGTRLPGGACTLARALKRLCAIDLGHDPFFSGGHCGSLPPSP